jgi:hypothetical protein
MKALSTAQISKVASIDRAGALRQAAAQEATDRLECAGANQGLAENHQSTHGDQGLVAEAEIEIDRTQGATIRDR